jgi:hypothetical protein
VKKKTYFLNLKLKIWIRWSLCESENGFRIFSVQDRRSVFPWDLVNDLIFNFEDRRIDVETLMNLYIYKKKTLLTYRTYIDYGFYEFCYWYYSDMLRSKIVGHLLCPHQGRRMPECGPPVFRIAEYNLGWTVRQSQPRRQHTCIPHSWEQQAGYLLDIKKKQLCKLQLNSSQN